MYEPFKESYAAAYKIPLKKTGGISRILLKVSKPKHTFKIHWCEK